MSCKIAYVLTLSFGARNSAPIGYALDEVLRLNPYRVIVVHDIKGPSGPCAQAAVAVWRKAYATVGVKVEIYAVDREETAHRWREGWIYAFEDLEVSAVFVFATDFDKPPSDSARDGWRKMVEAASADALVLGDYQPKPGSFKDEFYQLIARPTVEAIFPRESAALAETGLRELRTEFFIMPRALLERLRHDSILSTMDPTTDMAVTCLRSTGLVLRVLYLGSFEDQADTRDPLGELYQTTRYVFERIINLIRLNRSMGLDREGQVRLYEELLPVIDRTIEVGRYAARRNLERLHTNPKIAAYLPMARWGEQWVAAPFEGFSYLLDNPGNSLAKTAEGLPYIACDTSTAADRDLAFYRKLVAAVRALESHLRKFSFCPLSYSCMHVTLWDGINRANAGSLTADEQEEYAAHVRGLPASTAGRVSSILPPPVIKMDGNWAVKFKFKGLNIWEEAAALVALLEPADEKSRESVARLERQREVLDQHYAAFGKPRNLPWVQHVSVGYFWTRAAAAAANRHLAEWNNAVSAAIGDETIEFSSASLHSFRDMETFFRHSIPLPLPNVTTAAFLSGKPRALDELLERVRSWTESELEAEGFTGCVAWNRDATHATFMGNELIHLPNGTFNFNWLNNKSRYRQSDLRGFCRHIKALLGPDGLLFEIRHAAFVKHYCKCAGDRRRGWECESGAEFHSCDRTPFEASYYAYPAGPIMISGWPVDRDGSFGHQLYRLRKDAEEFGLLDKYHAEGQKRHWMDDDWYLRLGRVDGVPQKVLDRVVERVRERLAAHPPVTYPVVLADLRVVLYRNTLLTDRVSIHTIDEIIANPGVIDTLYRQVGESA